jgi:hypothetical protein
MFFFLLLFPCNAAPSLAASPCITSTEADWTWHSNRFHHFPDCAGAVRRPSAAEQLCLAARPFIASSANQQTHFYEVESFFKFTAFRQMHLAAHSVQNPPARKLVHGKLSKTQQ